MVFLSLHELLLRRVRVFSAMLLNNLNHGLELVLLLRPPVSRELLYQGDTALCRVIRNQEAVHPLFSLHVALHGAPEMWLCLQE